MTLKQKREIVRRFKQGEDMLVLTNAIPRWLVEQVLRDFINGKFTLEPKRRKRKRES